MSWDFFFLSLLVSPLPFSIVLSVYAEVEFSLVVKQTMSWHFHVFCRNCKHKGLTSGNHLLSSKNGKWYRLQEENTTLVSSKGVNTKNTTYNQLFFKHNWKKKKILLCTWHKLLVLLSLKYTSLYFKIKATLSRCLKIIEKVSFTFWVDKS